jgi:hypothetical protein
MPSSRGFLIGLSLVALVACSGAQAGDETGQAVFSLATVPDDIHCLRVSWVGAPHGTDQLIPTTPGQGISRHLAGFPCGHVHFSSDAFEEACTDLARESLPTWVSDPVVIELRPGRVSTVSLLLQRNSRSRRNHDDEHATCRNEGEPCRSDRECISHVCRDFRCQPAVSCGDTGESCRSDATCCSRNCVAGSCQPTQTCKFDQSVCERHDECCSGRCVDGACRPQPACGLVDERCGQSSDCCSGVCTDGTCRSQPACRPEGQACAINADCCSLNCQGNACRPTTCFTAGQSCLAHQECCSGVCRDGTCGPPERCLPDAQQCFNDEECCSGNCLAEICQPAQPCQAEGTSCTMHDACCSKNCLSNVCQPPPSGNLSCSQTVACIASCEDEACQSRCLQSGSADAQAHLETFLTCTSSCESSDSDCFCQHVCNDANCRMALEACSSPQDSRAACARCELIP